MKISKHQTRIVAALLALERQHRWLWWTRDEIGQVVAAGGYHATLQVSSVAALKRLGLIQTERSSWSPRQKAVTRCHCATYHWGLTDAGRALADSLAVRWSPDDLERVLNAGMVRRCCSEFEDEDDARERIRKWIDDRDDDDDFQEPRDPSPTRPLAPALV